jgi:hypothetical protein
VVIRKGDRIELLASCMAVRFRPDGDYVPIHRCFLVPESSDLILLADYYKATRTEIYNNLLRVTEDGLVIWAPDAPGGCKDVFTEAHLIGEILSANTWECFHCRVDLFDGSVSEVEFTK